MIFFTMKKNIFILFFTYFENLKYHMIIFNLLKYSYLFFDFVNLKIDQDLHHQS